MNNLFGSPKFMSGEDPGFLNASSLWPTVVPHNDPSDDWVAPLKAALASSHIQSNHVAGKQSKSEDANEVAGKMSVLFLDAESSGHIFRCFL